MFKKSKYYNDLELPLEKFIFILDKGDLSQLIISGKPSRKALVEAWDNIFEGYQQAMNSKRSKQFLNSIRYVVMMKNRLLILKRLVRANSYGYNRDLSELLNQNGIRTRVSYVTMERDLLRVLTEIKGMESNISAREEELKSEENTNIRGDFSRLLLRLSEHYGFNYNAKEHSVYDFCEAVKMMNESIKEANKKHKK